MLACDLIESTQLRKRGGGGEQEKGVEKFVEKKISEFF